jgi:hypothetical protein
MSPLRMIVVEGAITKGAGNIRSCETWQHIVLFNLRMTSLITIVRNSKVPFMTRRESF